jgi:hypothetical protein
MRACNPECLHVGLVAGTNSVLNVDMQSTKKTVKTQISLSADLAMKTRIEAAMQLKNVSDVVAAALSEYLDRQERLRIKKGGAA